MDTSKLPPPIEVPPIDHPLYHALRALAHLHRPVERTTKGFTEDPFTTHIGCTACQDHKRWPCDTARQVIEIIEVLDHYTSVQTDWGVRYGADNKGRARTEGQIEYWGTRPGGDIGPFDEGIARYCAETGRGDRVVSRIDRTIRITSEWETPTPDQCCCSWGAAIGTRHGIPSNETPEFDCGDCPLHGGEQTTHYCRRHRKEHKAQVVADETTFNARYCPDCEHPWGYHTSNGCSMPVVSRSSGIPVSRNNGPGVPCDCPTEQPNDTL